MGIINDVRQKEDMAAKARAYDEIRAQQAQQEALRKQYMGQEEGHYDRQPGFFANSGDFGPDGYVDEWVTTREKGPMAVNWGEQPGLAETAPRNRAARNAMAYPEQYQKNLNYIDEANLSLPRNISGAHSAGRYADREAETQRLLDMGMGSEQQRMLANQEVGLAGAVDQARLRQRLDPSYKERIERAYREGRYKPNPRDPNGDLDAIDKMVFDDNYR
jgi:hypothetical protein